MGLTNRKYKSNYHQKELLPMIQMLLSKQFLLDKGMMRRPGHTNRELISTRQLGSLSTLPINKAIYRRVEFV